MAAPLIIYHNAECSKSNGALGILSERGISFTTRFYLQESLTGDELRALLKKLALPASAIVRRAETLAQQLSANGEPDEEGWIQIPPPIPRLSSDRLLKARATR